MLTHLRYALRSLGKSPGFTATAIATLALCLGANLAIFAVVDAVLVRSLPFFEPNRIVSIFNSYPTAGVERAAASLPNYFDRRNAIKALESVSIYQDGSAVVGGTDSPNRLSMARVSPEFFQTLKVPLTMGRGFTEDQLKYGTDEVAVITDGFWRSQFNADPHVLNRTFSNDGITITVIGVLPRDFHFLSSHAQFFRPCSHAPEDRQPQNRHNNGWNMIGRLAAGATIADAQAQIDAFNAQQATDDPFIQIIKGSGYHTIVNSLHEDHVRTVKPMLVLLQCGVFFLLLIGTVNLANLLLIPRQRPYKRARRAPGPGRHRAAHRRRGSHRNHRARPDRRIARPAPRRARHSPARRPRD
jgi:hypothetical protein